MMKQSEEMKELKSILQKALCDPCKGSLVQELARYHYDQTEAQKEAL
jgi:hypothetical protein